MCHTPFHLRQTVFFCLLAFSAMEKANAQNIGQLVSQISPTALPTGGTTVAGTASINQSAASMTVTQTTQKAIIDWNTYNIGKDASVQYVQPNANASILNRVANGSSEIAGRLTSNGHVFLINPNGVLFSSSAQVNVGSLVAAAGNISNAAWLSGSANISNQNKVVNDGNIQASESVTLVGKQVGNTGSIHAHTITLAVGDEVRLNLSSDGLIQAQVTGATAQSLLDNSGLLQSDGGSISLAASTAAGTAGGLINHTGIIRANSITKNGGVVSLTGGDVHVDGSIDVSSQNGSAGSVRMFGDLNSGQLKFNGNIVANAGDLGGGGMVETSAAHVKIGDSARVDTASKKGRVGTWLIDPMDFKIGSGATDDISGVALSNNLNLGNVSIQSSAGSTVGEGNIYVNSPIIWSANTTLKLDAFKSIEFFSPMMPLSGTTAGVPNTTQNGIMNNISASGDTAGLVLNFDPNFGYRMSGSQVTMTGASPSLSINGTAYTVINSRDINVFESKIRNNLSGNFALLNDVDATTAPTTTTSTGIASWLPLGDSTNPFSGQLHGFGHAIIGLNIARPTDVNVGLFGYNTGTIRDLGVDNANITGFETVGAVAGLNFGSILNSHAFNVNVTALSPSGGVGGLVGENRQTIKGGFTTGVVTGDSYVGGLVGYNRQGEIYYSSSSANVNGGNRGGIGGLVGVTTNGLIVNSHYDVDTVTINGDHILTYGGVYHDQYLDWFNNKRGLNIANYAANLPQDPIRGDYLVSSVQGLRDLLGFTDQRLNFRLTTNIDLSNNAGLYLPIFLGQFDGAGFKISNLNLQMPKIVGLGLIGLNYGVIRNLGVENANINGAFSLGALAGINFGQIESSYSSGLVQGFSTVGGLVGANVGDIFNSNSSASVIAGSTNPLDTKAGGLVGEHLDIANISNSYANGKVNVGGGLIGAIKGVTPPNVSNSFWDTQTSGQSTSAAGRGKTTAELNTLATFVGWDFAKTWRILEGSSTPSLRMFSRGAFDLFVRANDLSSVYGSGAPSAANFSLSATGLQAGDTLASLGTALYDGTWQNALNVGTYTIAPSGLTSPKYDIIYTKGFLTITKAPLVISADDKSKVYGDQDPILSSSFSGLKYTDTADVVSGLMLSTLTGAAAVAGNAEISINGGSANNYNIIRLPGKLTVIKAPLTVTADNKSKVYGDLDPTLTSTITGLKYTDTAAVLTGVTLTTVTGASAVAGNFAITNSGGSANNYNIINVPGILSVSKAPLTVSADSKSKVYGDLDPLLTSTVTGLRYADTPAVVSGINLSTVTGAAAVAGSFVINNSGGVASNYEVINVPGFLTVNRAPLMLTADNKNKVYGDADPALSFSASGLKYNDTAAVITGVQLSTPTGASAVAGSHTITNSGGTALNYTVVNVPGTLVVSKAALVVSADNKSKVYGDADPTLTTSITGLKYADTAAVLSGLTTSAVTGAAAVVGDHVINSSGGNAQNYIVSTYKPGILNVTKAALTVSADNKAITFGNSLPALTYTVSGLKYNDSPSVVTGVALSTTSTASVGTHSIVTVGGAAQNYSITDINGILLVNAAPVTEAAVVVKSLEVVAAATPAAVAPAPAATAASAPNTPVAIAPAPVNTQRKLLFAPASNAINQDPNIGSLKDCGAGNMGDCIATPRVAVQAQIDENGSASAVPMRIKRKLALVIGNNTYSSPLSALDGAVNDSGAIAKLLAQQGYEVNNLANANRSQMISGLNKLITESHSDESVLVFYAGHGYIHPGSSVAYWLPTDAHIDDPRGWLSNIDIARFLSNIPARQVMLISDSCFSGALTREGGAQEATTSLSRNAILSRRSVVAMSSGGEEPVADTAFDGHSPFTFFLLKEMQNAKGEIYAKKVLQNVREKVTAQTAQVPSYGAIVSSGHMEGGEYLLNPVKE